MKTLKKYTENEIRRVLDDWNLESVDEAGQEVRFTCNPDYYVSKRLGNDCEFWADAFVITEKDADGYLSILSIESRISVFESDDGEIPDTSDITTSIEEILKHQLGAH